MKEVPQPGRIETVHPVCANEKKCGAANHEANEAYEADGLSAHYMGWRTDRPRTHGQTRTNTDPPSPKATAGQADTDKRGLQVAVN